MTVDGWGSEVRVREVGSTSAWDGGSTYSQMMTLIGWASGKGSCCTLDWADRPELAGSATLECAGSYLLSLPPASRKGPHYSHLVLEVRIINDITWSAQREQDHKRETVIVRGTVVTSQEG